MRRTIVPLLALAGAMLIAPAAGAATLGVDDDGAECPAAAYATIQAAIDAAAPGDTVAVCPGTYVEGSGAAGTNALTIAKSLTLRGAGADLVKVMPRRTNAAGGQIAEVPSDLANGVGDIVAVTGTPAAPVTASLAGMTFDGNGVFVEAGVVFAGAQGSVTRSRVTNVVTTEAANAFLTPGGWRGDFPGAGIAQVGAAGPLVVDNVRVDRYNRAGVWLDGGDAKIETSEIVGRILCQNFTVDGNCSAPGVVADGPLFGQDGVRVTGGASVALTDSSVSSNLVNGAGAPVRNATTGNENLGEAAGVRLLGADAAGSLITRNNLVDNGYGVFNDGAVPVPAPDNWWGLRYMPAGPNPGPAVSPATNPPFPENPVNGASAATGSTTVAFIPFRAGPQSDPLTGQFPNVQAPMPMNDAAPVVTLAATPAVVARGGTITLTATATDDVGIAATLFSEGATPLGGATTPPYAVTVPVPADAPCGPRTFSVTAIDSLGQTSSATATATVTGPNNCQPLPSAPTIALPGTLNAIPQRGADVAMTVSAAAGVARVELFLGTRQVCTRTSAPYTCRVVPTPADVGLQTLRAVVTDTLGRTAEASRQVLIDRFRSRGVKVAVKEKKLRRDRSKRTITATVRPPAGTRAAQVCRSGTVTFVVERRGRQFINRQVRLRKDCTAKLAFTARRAKKKIYAVDARFGGNTVLQPAHATRRFS